MKRDPKTASYKPGVAIVSEGRRAERARLEARHRRVKIDERSTPDARVDGAPVQYNELGGQLMRVDRKAPSSTTPAVRESRRARQRREAAEKAKSAEVSP